MTGVAVRLTAIAIFVAAMIWLREVAHVIISMGFLTWLAVITAIFAIGILIENKERKAAGRAPYSLAESRELLLPLSCLAIIMTAAYWVAR